MIDPRLRRLYGNRFLAQDRDYMALRAASPLDGVPAMGFLPDGAFRAHFLVSAPGLPVAVPVDIPCVAKGASMVRLRKGDDVLAYLYRNKGIYAYDSTHDGRLTDGIAVTGTEALALAFQGIAGHDIRLPATDSLETFSLSRKEGPARLLRAWDIGTKVRPMPDAPSDALRKAQADLQLFVSENYVVEGGRVFVLVGTPPHFRMSVTARGHVEIEPGEWPFHTKGAGRRTYAFVDVANLGQARSLAERLISARSGARLRCDYEQTSGHGLFQFNKPRVASLHEQARTFVYAARQICYDLPPASLAALRHFADRLAIDLSEPDMKGWSESLRAAWLPVTNALGDTHGRCAAADTDKPEGEWSMTLHATRSILDDHFGIPAPAEIQGYRSRKLYWMSRWPLPSLRDAWISQWHMRPWVWAGGRIFAEAWQEADDSIAAYLETQDVRNAARLADAMGILSYTAPEDFIAKEHAIAWAFEHRQKFRQLRDVLLGPGQTVAAG